MDVTSEPRCLLPPRGTRNLPFEQTRVSGLETAHLFVFHSPAQNCLQTVQGPTEPSVLTRTNRLVSPFVGGSPVFIVPFPSPDPDFRGTLEQRSEHRRRFRR